MTSASLSAATREKLRAVSTATICTALFKRGLRNQMIQGARPLDPGKPNMVGPAFTLRYIPAREDLNPISVFQDRGHPQRKAVEECPPGAVFVVDSRKDPRAASAGSILLTRLMKRGCAGFVTDGGLRDAAEIARLDIPTYHQRPSAPTNLTLHQAMDINVPIGCGDAPVFPGDIIVGDADGCVVIPAHLADEIADEAVEMTAFEDFVTEQVLAGRSILGLYPATDEQTKIDFAAWAQGEGALGQTPRAFSQPGVALEPDTRWHPLMPHGPRRFRTRCSTPRPSVSRRFFFSHPRYGTASRCCSGTRAATLARWYEGTLVVSRSTVYGGLLYLLQAPNFWPMILLQAALAAWTIALLLRTFGLARPAGAPRHRRHACRAHHAAVADEHSHHRHLRGPRGARSLPPHLLVAKLSSGERGGLFALVTIAVASHSATLLLILGSPASHGSRASTARASRARRLAPAAASCAAGALSSFPAIMPCRAQSPGHRAAAPSSAPA